MLERFNRVANKSLVTDSIGKGLTIALFKETNDGRTDIKPIWSLRQWKEVYLDICDPTEYEAAMYLIGDWSHWQRIADVSACSVYIKEWREELRVKLRSRAIAQLKAQAMTPKGTAAAKYLADGDYDKVKRTKKHEMRLEAQESAEERAIIQNAERLKSAV